jgi:UDP-N-acetyl-D-glucosamine dehydrogenase
MVVLESTTYPGTTRDVVLPILLASGLKPGIDFALAYSPEREDPGNPKYSAGQIPKVVGGLDAISQEMAVELYRNAVVEVVPVSSCDVAEACKILENTYRSVNIALVNELKVLFDRMGIDVWEVIEAAKTKPFGFQAFYPGPGLGGHCIPIDPFYLSWVARKHGLPTRFIELAGEINTAMPNYVVQRVGEALNDFGKPLRGSKVCLLGVAYKRDVDDSRESPAFTLMELLGARGAVLSYNDPHVPVLPSARHHELPKLESQPLTAEFLASQDCILIVTDHSAYDYEFIVRHARVVVDTRNAARNVVGMREKIYKA